MLYGEPTIRKAVPLAIGLVSVSNPLLPILDTLSKYSHDNDLQVAINAIFAMGLVGAGTNNARLAQMLRQLAGYYQKEPDSLFMVRIAQGMVHMGKGTIGLNPFFSDRSIMSRPAVAGLLATLTAFTDAKSCDFKLFFPTCIGRLIFWIHHSYTWQVSLDVVPLDPRHVSSFLDYSRWETWKLSCYCPGRAGEFFFLVHFISGVLIRFLRTGHWRCWSGWEAKNNIWVPDASIAGATWDHWAGRTGNGGVYSI